MSPLKKGKWWLHIIRKIVLISWTTCKCLRDSKVCVDYILRMATTGRFSFFHLIYSGNYTMTVYRQHIKKHRHYFANKGLSSQGYGFSSSHVWMWELDYRKAESQRIDVFELWCWKRLLRVPWTARKCNQFILKEIDQSWVFIGRTDVEAATSILWPPDAKSWLIWKDPDAGKDWGQEEKGMTEDETVGWHHQLNGHGFG